MTYARRVVLAVIAACALSVAMAALPVDAAGHNRQVRHVATRPVPAAPIRLTAEQARAILVKAAHHQRVNPNFVLAVSYWESGWNQAALSPTGAVGLMQIEPSTAAWAGPSLLHRSVSLTNPVDNAELGAALLRSYLTQLHDPKLVLAAYYQGLSAVRKHGIYKSSRPYVDGIWRLRNRFQAQPPH